MVVEQKESDKNNDLKLLKLDIFHPFFFPEANLEPLKTPEIRSISPRFSRLALQRMQEAERRQLAWQSEESPWVFPFFPCWKLMAGVYTHKMDGPGLAQVVVLA